MKKSSKFLTVAIVVIIAIVMILSLLRKDSPQVIIGATSTLDGVDFPTISIGGKKSAQKAVTMIATSSALCSVGPSDVGLGTSTARFSFNMSTSSIAKSEYVSLSTSTTRYGSSSIAWLHVTVPAYGSQFGGAFLPNTATGTNSAAGGTTGDTSLLPGLTASGTSNYIVLPSEKLNLRIGTATPGTFATFPQGVCSYEFIQL